MHKARSNRKKNGYQLFQRLQKQRPASQEEITERTKENAAAKQERYPYPPAYRYEMSGPQPEQPACYTVWYVPGVRYARNYK